MLKLKDEQIVILEEALKLLLEKGGKINKMDMVIDLLYELENLEED